MKHEFVAGDHVEWNSEGGGCVRGTIMKQVTSAAFANRLVPNALDVLERSGDLSAHDQANVTPRDAKGASDGAIS